MPTERSQKSRYVIPDVIDPEGICCVQVPVPDDPDWRAQFLGALWRLSLQTHYERDDGKLGTVIAARWRQVYEETRDGMSICNQPSIMLQAVMDASFSLALNVEFTANGLDGIAPDRPDTFFDEDTGDTGDEVQQRINALCNACQDYVNTVAQNAWDLALATGVTVSTLGVPIIFAINPIAAAGAALLMGALTQEVLDALADESNRLQIACCMFENMSGVAVTQANFEASLTGCGFAALSQIEIMRDLIEGTLNDGGNWLSFVSAMGGFMAASTFGATDCQCIATWTHTWLNGDGLQDLDIIEWPDPPNMAGSYNSGDDEIEAGCCTLSDCGLFGLVDITFPLREITRVKMTVGVNPTRSSPSDHLRLWDGLMDDGDLLADEAVGGAEDKIVDSGVISIFTTQVQLEAVVATTGTTCAAPARNDILQVTIEGVGTDPFL